MDGDLLAGTVEAVGADGLDVCLSIVVAVDLDVGASPDACEEVGRPVQLHGGEFNISACVSSPRMPADSS